MAKVVKADQLPADVVYEPPLRIEFGVNGGTVGAQGIVMGRTVIPPGGKNLPHLHLHCEAAQYVISGHLRMWAGDDVNRLTPHDVPAGHFCYIPRGEIHSAENPSDSEPVVLIFSYGGVADKEAAGTISPESLAGARTQGS